MKETVQPRSPMLLSSLACLRVSQYPLPYPSPSLLGSLRGCSGPIRFPLSTNWTQRSRNKSARSISNYPAFKLPQNLTSSPYGPSFHSSRSPSPLTWIPALVSCLLLCSLSHSIVRLHAALPACLSHRSHTLPLPDSQSPKDPPAPPSVLWAALFYALHTCVLCGSVVSDSVRPHGLKPAKLLCPWILQARILEWVAMPSSRGSSRPRDRTCVSYVYLHWQEGSLPLAPTGKPLSILLPLQMDSPSPNLPVWQERLWFSVTPVGNLEII